MSTSVYKANCEEFTVVAAITFGVLSQLLHQ